MDVTKKRFCKHCNIETLQVVKLDEIYPEYMYWNCTDCDRLVDFIEGD